MSEATDRRKCFDCDYCGMDMDLDPYCVAPAVVAEHPYGLVTRQALPQYCGADERRLWIPRRPR